MSMLYLASFATSVVAHAAVLTTLRGMSLARGANDAVIEPSAVPVVLDLALGLDSSTEESKVWVGFNEPEKHRAAPGEVDQAAFTEQPIAAAAQQPAAEAPPMNSAPASEQSPPQAIAAATPAPPQTTPQSREPSDRAVSELLGINHLVASNQLLMREAGEEETTESEPLPSPATQPDAAAAPAIDSLVSLLQQLKEAAEQMSAAREPQPAPSQPSPPPAPPSDEAIAMKATSGAREVGAQSDRESDATSAIDVPREHWQLGRPLAARGLEIKPRRPDVTILTSLTAWPRNPLCRITFQRDGVPKKAELLRNTGDSRVDAAIEASLYRWRAAGKPLEALKDGDTIDVTIRLVINPERKTDASAAESP
jgi:hypothetical protein